MYFLVCRKHVTKTAEPAFPLDWIDINSHKLDRLAAEATQQDSTSSPPDTWYLRWQNRDLPTGVNKPCGEDFEYPQMGASIEIRDSLINPPETRVSHIKKIFILFERCSFVFYKSPSGLRLLVLCNTVLALLVGIVFYDAGFEDSGVTAGNGIFCILVTAFWMHFLATVVS